MKTNLLFATALFVAFQLPLLWRGAGVRSQNIGISTDATAPETGLMLDIKAPPGYAKNANNSAQPFFQIKSFDTDATALKFRMGLRTDATQNNRYGYMEFLEAGTPTYLHLALQPSGGNVGIGTASPADALNVQCNFNGSKGMILQNLATGTGVYTRCSMLNDAGNQAGLLFGSSTATGYAGTNGLAVGTYVGGGNLQLYTGNSPRATIDVSGNVGIGTITPNATFDIKGFNGGSHAKFNKSLGSGGNAWGFRLSGYSSLDVEVGYIDYEVTQGNPGIEEANLNFATISNGTLSEKMKIKSDGNVGIGITNPAAFLSVAGNAIFGGANVVENNASVSVQATKTSGQSLVSFRQGTNGAGANGSNSLIVINDNGDATSSIAQFVGAGSERMRVTSGGNVGIGVVSPSDKLEVYNGTSTGKYTSSGWIHSSDARLKTNIQPLENALDKVKRLNGVYYHWKNNPESNRQMGFIAQDVEKVIPEVIVKDADGNYSMVHQNLTAVLVEAIKEQDKKYKEQIESLQKQVSILSGEVEGLKREKNTPTKTNVYE